MVLVKLKASTASPSMDTSTLEIFNSVFKAEKSPFEEESQIKDLGLLASFFAKEFPEESEIVANADTNTVYKIYEINEKYEIQPSQSHYKYATLFVNAPKECQHIEHNKLSLSQETEARKKQAYNCHRIGPNDGQLCNPCWVAEIYNYTDVDKTIRNFLSIVGFYCEEVDIIFNGHGSPDGLLFECEPKSIPQSRMISDASRIWSEIKRNKVNEEPTLKKIKVVLAQCYSHLYNPNDNPEVGPIIEAIPLSTHENPFTYYSLTWGSVADTATDGPTGSQGQKRIITGSHHPAAEDYIKRRKSSTPDVCDPSNNPAASIDVLPGEVSDSTSVMNEPTESEESSTLQWIANGAIKVAKAVVLGTVVVATVTTAAFMSTPTQSSSASENTVNRSTDSDNDENCTKEKVKNDGNPKRKFKSSRKGKK